MKSYVITIKDNPASVASAERCIRSAPSLNTKMHYGFTPKDNPIQIMKDKGINSDNFNVKFSYHESCCAAFLSHHSLWEKCVETREETIIFEHDAVVVGDIPEFLVYDKVVSLGAPSYGQHITPPFIGVGPLTSKQYFPGAHAYRLKPPGAKALIEMAKRDAGPTDVFLALPRFPWLQEFHPWPVVCRDSFTTIQRELGCQAKHSYNENYKIMQ